MSREYQDYAATCYHAEQYAEKVLKDKLWLFRERFFKTHSLAFLAKDLASCYGIQSDDDDFRKVLERCHSLDDLYQKSRYPSTADSKNRVFSEKVAQKAVKDAEFIVEWVHSLKGDHIDYCPRRFRRWMCLSLLVVGLRTIGRTSGTMASDVPAQEVLESLCTTASVRRSPSAALPAPSEPREPSGRCGTPPRPDAAQNAFHGAL